MGIKKKKVFNFLVFGLHFVHTQDITELFSSNLWLIL